jgi:23S rRNA G2069 N7-methylase RlmK/C1962 C5-methylase RlmI
MPTLILKPGREKSLLRRHPWIFSGAIDCVDRNPASGETVDLLSSKGEFLARAVAEDHLPLPWQKPQHRLTLRRVQQGQLLLI